MKQLFKRITAALLLICLLSSFVVPATFADTAQTVTTTYAFDFYNSYNNIVSANGNTAVTANCRCGESHSVKDHLDGLYTQLGWKFAGNTTANYSNVEVRGSDDKGILMIPECGGWIAITLNVPQTGKYTLSMTGSSQTSLRVYMLEGTLTKDQITEKLADADAIANNVIISSLAFTNGVAASGELELNAGEHTVLVRNIHTSNGRNLYLKKIDLTGTVTSDTTEPSTDATGSTTETAVETQDQYLYPMDFHFTTEHTNLITSSHTALSAACRCGENHTVKEHLDTLYDSLGWKFAGNTTEDYSNVVARNDANQGLLIAPAYQGWTAITLKTPAANTYKISLIGNGGQGSIAVYLFEGALDQAQIAEKMADTSAVAGNLIKTGVKSARDENAVIGEMEFASEEYTLVLRNTHSSSGRNLYLNTIQLDKVVEEESTTAPSTEVSVPTTEESVPTTQETEPSTAVTVPSTEVTVPSTEETVPPVEGQYNYVMDFHHTAQYASLVGGNANKLISADCACGANHTIKAHLDTLYAQLGWKFAGNTTADYSNVEARSDKAQGLLIFPAYQGWTAITLNVPVADRYTIGLIGNGGQGSIAVYLFEGALTQDQIAEKMADTTLVADKLLKSNVKSARDAQAIVGEMDLAAQEYTLVLRNTHRSSSRNLYLNSIQLNKVVEEPIEPTQPPAPTVENVWNFDFYKDPAYANIAAGETKLSNLCRCGEYHTVKEHLDSIYGQQGWKIAGTSDGNYGNIWVYENDDKGTLFQPAVGGWIAVTLWITKAGKQTLYATASNTTQSGINTYIFEGDLNSAQVAEKLADSNANANLVRKGISIASGATGAIGSWDFVPGAYTLVIRNAHASKARNFWLRKIELGEFDGIEATEPGSTSEPDDTIHTGVCDGKYTEGIYNFALYTDDAFKPMLTNDKGNFADAGMNGDCYNCGKPLAECFAEQYASNQINWLIEGSNFRDLNILASTYTKYNYGGLRMRYNSAGEEATGLWNAFRVKVAKEGEYTISFQKDYPYGYSAEIYIFPAEAETMSAAKLEAGMTDANRVGTLAFAKNGKSLSLGKWNFPTAGDYIVALKTVAGNRIYLNGMTFKPVRVPAPIAPADKVLYDFDLMARDKTFEKKGITGRFTKEPLVYIDDILNGMYEKGEILWKYELSENADAEKVISFRQGCLRWKPSGNFKELTPWSAFRIKNPGTATYDIRITSSSKSSIYADIYMIPAPTETLNAQKVEELMTAENLMVKDAIINGKDTFYMGEYTFGMEEEYLLILHIKKGGMFYLQNIQMTKDGLVADEAISKKKVINGTVYDFDLTDQMDGIFEGVLLFKDLKKDVDSLYNSGALNWKWVDSSEGLKGTTTATMHLPGEKTHKFYPKTGMRIYTSKNGWTAYKIKSPGSGTFTVTLNHAIYNQSGTVAVYIVPADTEDIWAATDPTNRIGKVNMSADISSLKDGITSFVGYWDFEAGKEYIVVLEAYENSLYSTKSYMNISQLVMERGKIAYEDTDKKTPGAITVVEDAIPVADAGAVGALTYVNGREYYVIPCEGGTALVFDLQTRQQVDSFQTGFSKTLDAVTDKDGIVWIVGASKSIVRYDPYTQEATKVASFLGREDMASYSGYFSMTYDYDNHRLYLGNYYGAGLACYDIESKEYTYLGRMAESATAVRGLTYHNGYLYYNVYNAETCVLHKYDISAKKVVATLDVRQSHPTSQYCQYISVIDDEFLMVSIYGGGLGGDLTVNMETFERMETTLPSSITGTATSEVDGIYYFACLSNGLYQYDTKTKEFSKVPGFGNTTAGLRNHDIPLLTFNGERCVFTYRSSSSIPFQFFVYNLDQKTTEEWLDMDVRGAGGATLRTPMNWEPGSNKMSFGAFNVEDAVVYDIVEGKIVDEFETRGQTDSQIWYKGKYYCGVYSATILNEIDIETNEMTQRWKLDHAVTGQKRIHTLAAGDDKIFAGTIPDTDQYGGAIVVYDTTNAKWFYHRHVVQDQAIVKLVYHDKLLYGATRIGGGSGSSVEGPKDTSAVVFVYDYEKRETIAILDPRDYIPGLSSRISYLSVLEADPNVEENGRFWAVVSETLFTFTFNKETKKFDVQEVISFDKLFNADGTLFARNIEFDTQRNYIYCAFDTKGGFQRLEVEDLGADKIKVKSNMRLLSENPTNYTLGEDGNLYYTIGGDLKLFPLNVTDEDWAIAENVDNMIASIASPVTLECEADVKNARSALDNLSWYYKTLIQNEEKLLEIETDLLECKIDTIVVEEVTADSLPMLQELKDEYDGQNERQQRYTKNYPLLKETYDKASKLNDERIAAAMQKRIDDLKPLFPLTLDNEPTVLEIRADFDAMTHNQQALVDTTILLDAEAQIVVLRAEFVKYVESLIQAIPKEITLEAEPAIIAAREAADKLYAPERKLVSYSVLTAAETKLRGLQTAKAAAEETDALIQAIGIVTLGDKDRIAAARASYDALSETALQFVTKGKKLQRAEFILKALQTWGIPVITVANAGIAFAVIWFVPSLHQKVFKGKKEEETPAGEEESV